MTITLLFLAAAIFGLGWYIKGQRMMVGDYDFANHEAYKAQYALATRPDQDRAPTRFVVYPCRACSELVEYPIELVATVKGEIRANVDQSEFERHKLSCRKAAV